MANTTDITLDGGKQIMTVTPQNITFLSKTTDKLGNNMFTVVFADGTSKIVSESDFNNMKELDFSNGGGGGSGEDPRVDTLSGQVESLNTFVSGKTTTTTTTEDVTYKVADYNLLNENSEGFDIELEDGLSFVSITGQSENTPVTFSFAYLPNDFAHVKTYKCTQGKEYRLINNTNQPIGVYWMQYMMNEVGTIQPNTYADFTYEGMFSTFSSTGSVDDLTDMQSATAKISHTTTSYTSGLTDSISANTSNISTNRGNINVLYSQISNINNTTTSLSSKVESLEGTVSGKTGVVQYDVDFSTAAEEYSVDLSKLSMNATDAFSGSVLETFKQTVEDYGQDLTDPIYPIFINVGDEYISATPVLKLENTTALSDKSIVAFIMHSIGENGYVNFECDGWGIGYVNSKENSDKIQLYWYEDEGFDYVGEFEYDESQSEEAKGILYKTSKIEGLTDRVSALEKGGTGSSMVYNTTSGELTGAKDQNGNDVTLNVSTITISF